MTVASGASLAIVLLCCSALGLPVRASTASKHSYTSSSDEASALKQYNVRSQHDPGAADRRAIRQLASNELDVLDVPLKLPEKGGPDRLILLPEVIEDNLMDDMKYWRPKAPLPISAIAELRTQLLTKVQYLPDCIKTVLIYENNLYFLDRKNLNLTGCPHPCSPFLETLAEALATSMKRRKVVLPNTLFIIDTNDNAMRWCGPHRTPCPAPLLSLQKYINGSDVDTNILIPQFMHTPKSIYQYPWDRKIQKAFFRGSSQCPGYKQPLAFKGGCPRTWMAYRSMSDRPDILDVAFTDAWTRERDINGKPIPDPFIPVDIPRGPETSIKEHAKYAYLLALDGVTASSRLAFLLNINSVIIKSKSPYHEYYYRSLKPDVHYKTMWNTSMDDVIDLLTELKEQAKQDPAPLHAMIQRAQAFAVKATHFRPRLLYWKAALTEFRSLFPDMDTHIEQLVKDLKAKGYNLSGFDVNSRGE